MKNLAQALLLSLVIAAPVALSSAAAQANPAPTPQPVVKASSHKVAATNGTKSTKRRHHTARRKSMNKVATPAASKK